MHHIQVLAACRYPNSVTPGVITKFDRALTPPRNPGTKKLQPAQICLPQGAFSIARIFYETLFLSFGGFGFL